MSHLQVISSALRYVRADPFHAMTDDISTNMICNLGSKDIAIVMGNNSGGKISQCTIGDLYPFPSVYRFQNRNDIASFSKLFSSKLKESPASILEEHGASAIYKLALNCVQHDKGSKLHPLQMAAAVLYSDNSTDVAWQLKGVKNAYKRSVLYILRLYNMSLIHFTLSWSSLFDPLSCPPLQVLSTGVHWIASLS